jgi:hypothetical protein
VNDDYDDGDNDVDVDDDKMRMLDRKISRNN